MKNKRIEVYKKVASGKLTPEQADEKLLSLFNTSDSMPNDFDEWISKVEKECVIDMDLPHIIWHDFFKPRGIFPKNVKGSE